MNLALLVLVHLVLVPSLAPPVPGHQLHAGLANYKLDHGAQGPGAHILRYGV